MVFALFRAWRVTPQLDDRRLPSNGLRFVPALAIIPQRDDRPLPGNGSRFAPGLACKPQQDDRPLPSNSLCFVPGLACKTSAGRSAISRQWSSLCSGRVVKYLSGTSGLFPATVFALFRAWRVIPQRDDRQFPGNGLRFVPGLACNISAGRSATSRQRSSLCSGPGV